LLVFAAVVVALALFEYAFISVWCFFAAIMTGTLCWWLNQLPPREPRPA
jgi:hypothetical protein